ncbi:MAG: LysM peptidoglycan-binding domain-containing protein [Bacteroidota bacterium]
MHRYLLILFIASIFLSSSAYSKNANKNVKPPEDSTVVFISDDPIIEMLDSMIFSKYLQCVGTATDTATLNIYKYTPEEIPAFTDIEYEARIKKLKSKSPFPYVYNKQVKDYIDLYANRKRKLTSRVLGLAKLYFPMFEQVLDMYNMPIELKYLAIVESALNPFAVSRVGATGLWQFMYNTGKMYDLEVSSYIDDRYDPYKETVAACEFMQDLYNVYGDWALVLAAYNSGPGNVNKAIRRSGGKTDFWEIKQYLPKETQGYVPAFIAVSYVMNYSTEHNIYPFEPKLTYYHLDTLNINRNVSFDQISAIIKISPEDLRFLNPQFKKAYIPASEETQKIILPATLVGDFINNQENIYNYISPEERLRQEQLLTELNAKNNGSSASTNTENVPEFIYHTVKKGQYLSVVAAKYGCTTSEIKEWNKLKSNTINVGQRVKIYTNTATAEVAPKNNNTITKNTLSKTQVVEKIPLKDSAKNNSTLVADNNVKKTEKADKDSKKKEPLKFNSKYKYYTVQKGDTLWSIANKYKGVTVEEIKKHNNISNAKSLSPGKKLKIPVTS